MEKKTKAFINWNYLFTQIIHFHTLFIFMETDVLFCRVNRHRRWIFLCVIYFVEEVDFIYWMICAVRRFVRWQFCLTRAARHCFVLLIYYFLFLFTILFQVRALKLFYFYRTNARELHSAKTGCCAPGRRNGNCDRKMCNFSKVTIKVAFPEEHLKKSVFPPPFFDKCARAA